jgi:hypothetical protein
MVFVRRWARAARGYGRNTSCTWRGGLFRTDNPGRLALGQYGFRPALGARRAPLRKKHGLYGRPYLYFATILYSLLSSYFLVTLSIFLFLPFL